MTSNLFNRATLVLHLFREAKPLQIIARLAKTARDPISHESPFNTVFSRIIFEHSLLHSRARLGFTEWTAEEIEMMKPVRQALVRQHPATGRKSIYISSHAGHVVGWTEAESKLFLSDLTEIATQRAFVYTHEWTVNDLVMWDNRCVLHRARSYEPGVVRDMRRTTIAGDEATVAQAA